MNLRGCSASHGALWTGTYSNVQAWHYNQRNVPKPEMLRRWGGDKKGTPPYSSHYSTGKEKVEQLLLPAALQAQAALS